MESMQLDEKGRKKILYVSALVATVIVPLLIGIVLICDGLGVGGYQALPEGSVEVTIGKGEQSPEVKEKIKQLNLEDRWETKGAIDIKTEEDKKRELLLLGLSFVVIAFFCLWYIKKQKNKDREDALIKQLESEYLSGKSMPKKRPRTKS